MRSALENDLIFLLEQAIPALLPFTVLADRAMRDVWTKEREALYEPELRQSRAARFVLAQIRGDGSQVENAIRNALEGTEHQKTCDPDECRCGLDVAMRILGRSE